MATKKSNNYIEFELEWLEAKALELREYCDANPMTSIEARMAYREVRGGGMVPMVVETIGQQIKTIRDTLKDYATLIEAIDKLREKEASKKLTSRGDQELSPLEARKL